MIRIFFGEDRVEIQKEIKKVLGEDYEVLDGEEIEAGSLYSVFFGTSLFGEKRKILIKDFGINKENFEKLGDFLTTEHEVVLFESKLDKRTVGYKNLKAAGIEMREFKQAIRTDMGEVFEIFDVAMRDGKKAVEMLEKIEDKQDPFMFLGLMASQAMKRLEWKQGEKEKRVLKELSKLDIQLKTTPFSPWILVKSFLLQVSSL